MEADLVDTLHTRPLRRSRSGTTSLHQHGRFRRRNVHRRRLHRRRTRPASRIPTRPGPCPLLPQLRQTNRDHGSRPLSTILCSIQSTTAQCARPDTQRHGTCGLAFTLPARGSMGSTTASFLVRATSCKLLVSFTLDVAARKTDTS